MEYSGLSYGITRQIFRFRSRRESKEEKIFGTPAVIYLSLIHIYATDVFGAAIRGDIKGLYIYGEDPVVTDADTNHIIKALESLDFFVLQELFMTETAQYADVILPGMSYAEKEGTFSNTERRVQRVRKAVDLTKDPSFDIRSDIDIIIDLMNRMGYPQPRLTPAQIMDEIASLTPSFGGISHARLDSEEVGGKGLQWPCPAPDHPGTPIMHVGGFTRGLGWLYPTVYTPSAELPDEEYPLYLMTGRILYHYTTRAMTGRTPGPVSYTHLLANADAAYHAAAADAVSNLGNLTAGNFLIGNLLPVTLGNIVGGSVMVGCVYWFAYLQTSRGKSL